MQVALDGGSVRLSEPQKQSLLNGSGHTGLRMLALAYKDIMVPMTSGPQGVDMVQAAAGCDVDQAESDLVLIGMVGLEDPGENVTGGHTTLNPRGMQLAAPAALQCWRRLKGVLKAICIAYYTHMVIRPAGIGLMHCLTFLISYTILDYHLLYMLHP